MKLLDLTNQRFGKLTIIGLSETKKFNQRYWEYLCDCGNKRLASTSNLRTGKVKSCGCDRTNTRRGENHPFWSGDNVGYFGVHIWAKKYLIKPQTCRDCNQVKPLDLANISQEYKRDLSDWEWLCRKCHMLKDGRYEKYSKNSPRKGKKYPR